MLDIIPSLLSSVDNMNARAGNVLVFSFTGSGSTDFILLEPTHVGWLLICVDT